MESRTGKCVHTFLGHRYPIYSIALSPDEKYLASAGQRVRLWNFQTRTFISQFDMKYSQIHCLEFTRDGQYLLSGDEDTNIIVWKIPEGENKKPNLAMRDKFLSLAVDPNLSYVYSGDSKAKAKWWKFFIKPEDPVWTDDDELRFSELQTLEIKREDPEGIVAVRVNNTGRYVFIAAEAGYVKIYETFSRKERFGSYLDQNTTIW